MQAIRIPEGIKTIEIKKLKLYENNARTHSPEQVAQIVTSMRQYGFTNPVLVGAADNVIAGHGRIEGAKICGMTKVPFIRLGHLTPEQTRAYVLADNQIALNAGWDEDLLAKELQDLSAGDYDLSFMGFDDDFLEEMLGNDLGSQLDNKSVLDKDDEPEEIKEPEVSEEEIKAEEIPEVEENKHDVKVGEAWDLGASKLVNGDCLESLKALESDSLDSLVTDPPAGISFMGKDWDDDKGGSKQWISWMTEVMAECLRVLKPGAHGLVWAIPRTSHWTATALEDAGFEIRDVVTHLFGSGFPKSHNISKAIDKEAGVEREKGFRPIAYPDSDCWGTPNSSGEDIKTNDKIYSDRKSMKSKPGMIETDYAATPEAKKYEGYGTALKPASEHWILVRKPLSEDTIVKNVLKHGTGGINIDGCRVDAGDQDSLEKNWDRVQSAKRGVSATGLKPVDLSDRKKQGRFPANLVLSGDAPELLDEQSGELTSGASKSSYIQKASENKSMSGNNYERKMKDRDADSGGASRFFYCAKPAKSDKGEINNHPTVKSTKLMRYFITLVTPENGKVLDPFLGSGTTLIACQQLEKDCVGFEKDPHYCSVIIERWQNFTGEKACRL